MPIYAYQCKQCGNRFEELTAMARRDEVRCPECGGEAERAWNSPGVFGVRFSSDCKEGNCPHGNSCNGACACGCHGAASR